MSEVLSSLRKEYGGCSVKKKSSANRNRIKWNYNHEEKSLAIVVADQVSTSLCLWGKLPMAHVLSAMVMDFLL